MKRSKFSLTHERKLTMDMGQLVPIAAMEVLAGDSFQHHTSALIRFLPMLAPVMHPIHAKIHHWFVPWRLVWDDFEDFITGGEDGLDASVMPTINLTGAGNAAIGTLSDYLGVPTGSDITVSALYHRAYALIWNEWYRDTQLQSPLTIDLTSGPDTTTSTDLKYVSWDKDYFTTARPNEQLGPEIGLPLGSSAPVRGIGHAYPDAWEKVSGNIGETGGITTVAANSDGNRWDMNAVAIRQSGNTDFPNIYADLSNATAATINQLREAFALQKFAEWRNIYGGRYSEYLRTLGVSARDSRLQRPEYLGGGKQTIQISEVLQTSTGGAGVGDLKGHGIGAMRSNRYRKFFEEHGCVISLMSIMPTNVYQNALHRHWSRTVKTDFWHKELEGLGQQAILNKEVRSNHATPNGTFGYQDRYDEYRRHPSSVHGDFRSTLAHWHMARVFASDPALNSSFITANPTNRIFAQTTSDNILVMAQNKVVARRLVSKRARYAGLS